jgi:hypothetical protein
MGAEIINYQRRDLRALERPLADLARALEIGKKARKVQIFLFPHDAVGIAQKFRDQHLELFAPAYHAETVLWRLLTDPLDPETAVAMVTALLRAFQAKPDKAVTRAMLGLLGADDLGAASGLWEPIYPSPAVLALGCEKLIATMKFCPHPSELRAACCEARKQMELAHDAAERVRDFIRIADAVLLKHAYAEWERPWRLPEYRGAGVLMLGLHAVYGSADGEDEDAAFARLVEAEYDNVGGKADDQ